jgi:hypothetical protein
MGIFQDLYKRGKTLKRRFLSPILDERSFRFSEKSFFVGLSKPATLDDNFKVATSIRSHFPETSIQNAIEGKKH